MIEPVSGATAAHDDDADVALRSDRRSRGPRVTAGTYARVAVLAVVSWLAIALVLSLLLWAVSSYTDDPATAGTVAIAGGPFAFGGALWFAGRRHGLRTAVQWFVATITTIVAANLLALAVVFTVTIGQRVAGLA